MMIRINARLAGLAFCLLATPAFAQTTLTYSSWVPPTHHLTLWQAAWTAEVEKATNSTGPASSRR